MSQDPNAASVTPEQLKEKFETIGLAHVEPAELEVKPVEPIQANTPEQIIAGLRKELAEEREKNSAAHVALTNALDERDIAKRAEECAVDYLERAKKRAGELAQDRDRHKARAERLETQVDGQKAEKLVAMIDERQKLRTDIGHKDKQIADLTRKLDALQAQADASRTLARGAEQRAQGFEASLEAMQHARDKAQQERGGAIEELASIKIWRTRAEADIVRLSKLVEQLEAAAKPKPVAAGKVA